MNTERPKTNEAEKYSSLLSQVTGLEISSFQYFPELMGELKPPLRGEEKPFTYKLVLGNEGDEYKVDFGVVFCDRDSPGEWLPSFKWKVSYNNNEVLKGGAVNTSTELGKYDFRDRDKIHKTLVEELSHSIGGPDTEVPFMNFESYSVESLKGENSYFKNIYLALMTHMKERGLNMPPILSKRDYIREPMLSGDVDKVNKVLSIAMAFDTDGFDKRIKNHMEIEAEIIRKHVLWEADKRNHDVPIEEVFPYMKTVVIEKGRTAFGKYNILVVENDLYNYGIFTDRVLETMENDGRYKGSKIITEVNLPNCMDVCKSGRIDVILFDWTNPSHEEVWMVQPKTVNPFYEMYYGKEQGQLGIDQNGINIATPDGNLLDWEATKKKSEKVDIRNKWMDMITDACEAEGVEPPPFFIVRSASELNDISKIVSQKLDKPIS